MRVCKSPICSAGRARSPSGCWILMVNTGSVGVCSSLRVNDRGLGSTLGSWVDLGRLSMILDIVSGVIETLLVGIAGFPSLPLIWG